MVTVATSPGSLNLFEPERLLTIADVAALPLELPSGPVRYELNNGRLVVMPPPGDIHGGAQLGIASALLVQGQIPGHGLARTEVGVILRRHPDRLAVPDAAFTATVSLPLRLSPEGYHETIPDLILEVRSKNDTKPEVESKVLEYLQAGVRVVWLADPEKLTVTVYRSHQPPRVFNADDILTVDDVIPDFALKVRDGFR
jgi:Uma2 family endonuclease